METNKRFEIEKVIRACDAAFEISVVQRDVYSDLLNKICVRGNFFFVSEREKYIAYCAFYRNDLDTGIGYISLIGVVPECQDMHIGTSLLNVVLEEMKAYGMRECMLEVLKDNQEAIRFYKKNNFSIEGERTEKFLMKRVLI